MLQKLKQKEKYKVLKFAQKYFDKAYRVYWNAIRLSRSDSYTHNLMVCKICLWLLMNDIPFVTQARFTTGYRPDIVCPTHIKPIIEVRASETEKLTKLKASRIPEELQNKIIYVDCYTDDPEDEYIDETDLLDKFPDYPLDFQKGKYKLKTIFKEERIL